MHASAVLRPKGRVNPDEGLIVLVLTQTPRGRNPASKFLELVRASILN